MSTDSLVQGDSVVVAWSQLTHAVKSFGIIDRVALRWEPKWVETTSPMDVKVMTTLRAVINNDHGNYDPIENDTIEVPMTFEVGIRDSLLYPTGLDSSLAQRSADAKRLEGVHEITLRIDAIWVDSGSGDSLASRLPKGLYFDLNIDWRVLGLLDVSAGPGGLEATLIECYSTSPDDDVEVLFSWNLVPEAMEYDLEWTWVDDYRSTPDGNVAAIYRNPVDVPYDLDHNATRVTTSGTSYRIPLLYDHGYLVWRVRAVGRDPQHPWIPIQSVWSGSDPSGNLQTAQEYIAIPTHEHRKNWQVTTSFAEEGKRKEVMVYADGTSRSRQQITRNNSLYVPVIGETIYDAVGRPAVEIMPVPKVTDGCHGDSLWLPIRYVPMFNLEDSLGDGTTYRFDDLGAYGNDCGLRSDPLHQSSGAEHYYSTAYWNSSDPVVPPAANIPRSLGYPLAHTQYTKDNTGRVRSQGGVGPTFQLDGHATRHFYGKPEQIQLDRLFGSEAGYAQHYQKHVTIDPNGQASVTYVDMFGRTVATSLTCGPPTGMESVSSAADTLTSDLFMGLASTDSLLGQQVGNDAMVLTHQFTVPCNGQYEFSYGLLPEMLLDPCWVDPQTQADLCAQCVYELSIDLVNDCGETVWSFPNDPLQSPTIIGNIDFTDEGLMFSCSNPSDFEAQDLEMDPDLPLGEYTLTKTLRIHAPARDWYVERLTDPAYSDCIISFEEFLQPYENSIDTMACYLDCAGCYEAVGTLDDYLTSQPGATVEEFQLLRSQCDELCRVDSWCDVLYTNMCADLSLQGQYGTFEWTGNPNDQPTFPDATSVFSGSHINSTLRDKFDFVPTPSAWDELRSTGYFFQQPWLELDGNVLHEYRDYEGTRSQVFLVPAGMNFMPAVVDVNLVFEDTPGSFFTYPENLAEIADFLYAWQDGWERSLLRFHPEYCYWKNCRIYGEPFELPDDQSQPANTSDAFDGKLSLAEDHAMAASSGLLDPLNDYKLYLLDPFYTSGIFSAYADALQEGFDDYFSVTGGTYSMVQVAAAMARCNGVLPDPYDPNSPCVDFGDGSNVEIKNTEWSALRGMYSSLKYQLQKQRADDYVNTCDCPGLNYCIGEEDWWTWWDRMKVNTNLLAPNYWWQSYTAQPLNMWCQPCSRWRYTHYRDKVPRVADPVQIDGLQQSPMELAYQQFLQTGQCPVATAWQSFLNQLAQGDTLAQNITIDISENAGWSGVFLALNDMQAGSVAPSASLTVTTSSDEVTLTTTTGCTIVLQVDLNEFTDFSWEDITAIGQLVADPNSNSFTLYVHYNGTNEPGVAEVTGAMCADFDLAPCNFPRTCQPNQLARDVQELWTMMAAGGQFTTSSIDLDLYYPPGSTENVEELLGPSILARFNNPDPIWKYVSQTNSVLVRNPFSGQPSYRFDIEEAIPASFDFSVSSWSNVKYFMNLNADFANRFVIEGYNSSSQLIVTLYGTAWWEEFGEPDEPVSLGLCELPPSPDCAQDQFQIHEQLAQVLEDVIYDTDFSSSQWVDLFTSPNMSDALANHLCEEDPNNTPPLPQSLIAGISTSSSEFELTLCDCLTIEVPRVGGVVVGTALDLSAISLQGGTGDGPFTELLIPVVTIPAQSPPPFVHVTATCIEFYPCDTCNHMIDMEQSTGKTQEQMLAEKILTTDTIWNTYLSYKYSVDSLNDRLELGPNDQGFVLTMSYANFRRNGFWHSLPVYQEYLRTYKPGIDLDAPLQYLDSFVVWHSNRFTVQWAFSRYLSAIDHYNQRALLEEKPTMEPDSLEVFKALLLSDLLDGYVDMLFSIEPGEVLPPSLRTWADFDPSDPCIALYRNHYLRAYWALDSTTTDSTGRCPGFERFAPLSTYDDFLKSNLCCSDSGLFVLEEYLQRFTDNNAKCPGELPRLAECDSSNSFASLLEGKSECQRLYVLWTEALTTYNSPTTQYMQETGIVLVNSYRSFEEFERAGMCECVRDYLQYLDAYLNWKVGYPLPPPLMSIEEFCEGEPDPCEDLFYTWQQTIRDYNESEYASLEGRYLDINIDDYELFEEMGLCLCVEAYIAYLLEYIAWGPAMGPLPAPVSIETFCDPMIDSDCESIYWDYQDGLIDLQEVLDEINLNYHLNPPLALNFVSQEAFLEHDLCYCAEAYVAELELLLSNTEDLDLERLQGDPRLMNLMRWCELPVPCPPFPPPPFTSNPPLPPGPNDCVQSLLNAAFLNAQGDYNVYVQTIVNDLTERYNSTCLSAAEQFRMTFEDNEHHFTLYYYDQAGNLIRTVPPAGVLITDIDHPDDSVAVRIAADRSNGTHTYFTDHLLVSDHVYNSLGQPIRSGMPDQDGRPEWRTGMPLGLPSSLNITGVSFAPGGKGILTGWLENGSLDRGLVYGTQDGGNTWQRSTGLVGADLHDAHYPTGSTGFMVGDHGSLLRSSNGGSAWDLLPSTLLEDRPDLRTLFFTDASTGLVAGLTSYAAHTSDGGLTFSDITLPNSGDLLGAGFDGVDYVIAGTDATGQHGVLYTNTSLTGTWTEVSEMPTTADLNALARTTTTGELIAVGELGVLLRSTNNGQSWATRRTGGTEDLLDLAFVNDQVGIALVDSAGSRGVIRHTIDGGGTWVPLPDFPLADLADLFIYEVAAPVIKVLAVGADGRVFRILVNANGNVGFVPISGPSSPNLIHAWAGLHGGSLRGVAVADDGTMYFSANLLAGQPTWQNNTISGSTALQLVGHCPDANTVNGLCLVINGTDRHVAEVQWDLGTSTFSSNLLTGIDFETVTLNEAADQAYAVNLDGTVIEFDLAAFPLSQTIHNPAGGIPASMANAAFSNGTLVTTSADGTLGTTVLSTNVATWTDRTSKVRPLPIHAMDKGGAVGVAAQGTLVHKDLNGWQASPTPTHADLHGVAMDGSTAIVAGGSGHVFSIQPGNPGSYSAIPIPQPQAISSVAVANGQLYLGSNMGRVWYSPTTSSPVYSALDHNSGHILGLARNSGVVSAVGEGALVHRFGGTTRVLVHDLYTPPLNAAWLRSGLNGYVVGDANTLRHTTDGGQSWQVVPLGGTLRDLNGVHGNAMNRVLAVGEQAMVLSLQGTTTTPESTGLSTSVDLKDVAVTESGAAMVVGTIGSSGAYATRTVGGTWATQTATGPLNAAWAFPRYMADQPLVDTENSHEDLMMGGEDEYTALVRYTPYTGAFSGLVYSPVPGGLDGDVQDLWFHDRINGYATVIGGTGTTRLYRATGPIDHDTPFSWEYVTVLANGLAGQTNEALVEPATVAFSDRNRGFVGGTYAGSPAGFARTLNDEGSLYSQRFWYDALGRLVLSQNSKQFAMAPQRFSYSLYDELGRVFEAGELVDDSLHNSNRFQDLPPTNVSGAILPNVLDPTVLANWITSRPRHEVTRTYYDKALPLLTIPNFSQSHLRLRVASSCFYEEEYTLSNPNEYEYDHATHYSYDIHGNVKTLVQDHPQLGLDADSIRDGCIGCIDHRYKRLDYSYDLISGNVKQVRYQADQPDEFDHAYTYDADNRITEVRTSADGENWHTDAKYFYYAHGPLHRVELGDHIVQGTDYAYTLQGWLKGVNSDRLHPTTDMGHDGDIADTDPANDLIGRDAFGFSLGYYGDDDYKAISNPWDNDLPASIAARSFAPIGSSGTLATEHTPLYNGNIAHTTYTLQHFGLWDSGNGAQGQVLAQVYKYDQLNRLRTSQGVTGITTTNSWEGVNDPAPDRYRSEYTYDANGNILTAQRYDEDEDKYDEFSYKYQKQLNTGRLTRNRLYELFDEADSTNSWVNEAGGAVDIEYNPDDPLDPFEEESADLNGQHNYRYDQLGNLVHDAREEINEIHWTVAGKLRSVTRTPGSTREPLAFAYGASGQRTQKQVGDPDGTTPTGYREHYIRDAQGNIMATYRFTNNGPASLELQDRPMYGSSRLGTYGEPKELRSLMSWDPADPALMAPVRLNYELTDHLGNVAAVVTGRLLDGNGSGAPKQAELVSAQGYEPFGSLLPGRNYSSDNYRFAFQGMEKDDELHGNTGTGYDFGARHYDPRVGRFMSLDPYASKAADESPFGFAGNSPIVLVDRNGEYKYPADKEAAYRKDYPMITLYLEKMVRTDVMKSPVIMKAFRDNTDGFLTPARLFEALAWGNGPEVVFEQYPGWPHVGANGRYDRDMKRIEMNLENTDKLEKLLQSDASEEEKLIGMIGWYKTLLHETTHYGDRTRQFEDGVEVGYQMEDDVWSGDQFNADCSSVEECGNAYDPEEAKELIGQQRQTEEGQTTLPRVPQKKD